VLAPVPLGVQNTQAHDPAVLVNLNNVQHTDVARTNVNNEITNPNTHNGILNIFFLKRLS
jgi:hypothetical protein